MFMRNLALLIFFMVSNVHAEKTQGPRLGQPVSDELIKRWDRDIFPDGGGLPDGSGTAKTGQDVYEKNCLTCHGLEGTGGSADELAGAQHSLTDDPPDKVIGNYWPYATTIFDFIRRSMPLHTPGKLSNDQLYAVTAYLLYLNEIISPQQKINKKTLAKIKMPNRDGFINVYKQQN